jgi:DNA-binding transcriptional MerR regulator
MSIEAMKQALDALERGRSQIIGALVQQDQDEAIASLRQAIAEAEKQEPVCVAFIRQLVSIDKDGIETWKDEPLYISPPKREWVGLTDDKELWEMWVESPSDVLRFAHAIEAKLREKNT